MTLEYFLQYRPWVYHTTDKSSLAGIKRFGLQSAEEIVGLTGADARVLLAQRREERRFLPDVEGCKFSLRDQKPMSDAALRKCLEFPLTPSDWYRLINKRVFFWVSPSTADALHSAKATHGSTQVLLKVDARAFLSKYYARAEVTTINAGYAGRRPARRGLATFTPLAKYENGVKSIVELTIVGSVPDIWEFIA